MFAIFAEVSETTGYMLTATFDLAKDPRKLLMKTFWLAIVSASLVSTGYYYKDLSITRFASITHGFCVAQMYSSFNPYYLSVLPPSLTGIPHFVMYTHNGIVNFLFPRYFSTSASYQKWAIGFGVIACMVAISWNLLILLFKDTKGLNSLEVKALFEEKKKKMSCMKRSSARSSNMDDQKNSHYTKAN